MKGTNKTLKTGLNMRMWTQQGWTTILKSRMWKGRKEIDDSLRNWQVQEKVPLREELLKWKKNALGQKKGERERIKETSVRVNFGKISKDKKIMNKD